MTRRYITIKEAAEYLSVSDRTIRRLIADGELTGYRIGKQLRARIRVDLNAIDEHLMRPTRPPHGPAGVVRRSAAVPRDRQIRSTVEHAGPWIEGEPRKPPKANPLDREHYRYCVCGDGAVSHRWGRIFDERLISPPAVGPCHAMRCECKEFEENITRRRRKPAKYRGDVD